LWRVRAGWGTTGVAGGGMVDVGVRVTVEVEKCGCDQCCEVGWGGGGGGFEGR